MILSFNNLPLTFATLSAILADDKLVFIYLFFFFFQFLIAYKNLREDAGEIPQSWSTAWSTKRRRDEEQF